MTKIKSKRTVMIAVILMIVAFSASLLIVRMWHPLLFSGQIKLETIILVVFLAGMLSTGLSDLSDPTKFVGKFLVLTTVQFLSVLSILAAIVYVKYPDRTLHIYHLIGLFFSLLTIQSVFLNKLVNKSN